MTTQTDQTAIKPLTKKEQIKAFKETVAVFQKKWLNHDEVTLVYNKSRYFMMKMRQDPTIPLRYTLFPGDKEIFYHRDDIEAILEREMNRLKSK